MTDKDAEAVISPKELPLTFTVKYLGSYPARGLWGMKHTRKPVDNLVSQAKRLQGDFTLPLVDLRIDTHGASFADSANRSVAKREPVNFPVDSISYGVQDLVYTRVFSMIIVKGDNLDNGIPFECHSFICESRDQARQLTFALAAAFQEYGLRVKEEGLERKVRRFAIDLRSPEEQAADSDGETEA